MGRVGVEMAVSASHIRQCGQRTPMTMVFTIGSSGT
jgi:hypothetical protein